MGIDIRALAITMLLAFALYFTYGQFVLPWITVLPIVLALAIFAFPTPRWFVRSRSVVCLGVVLFFLAASAASLLPESPWLRSMIVDVADLSYLPAMRVLFGLAGVGCIGLSFAGSSRWATAAFGFVLVCMIAAFALIIPTSPRPQIDVWTVHEEGAQAFVEGRNPYTHEYTNIYSEELRPYLTPGGVTYSYMPGVFMWMSPWKALGLDTRYSQLVTRLCTALILLLIARRVSGRRDFMTYVPALLFITFPLNTFFIVRAWNDDISMMCYALAAYGMVSRRPWALFVASNFLLLHKQHAVFFVPVLIWFAWREWRDRWAWLKGTWVAALVCGGYLIADWRNFLGSLYGLTFLKFPNIHTVFLERRDPYSLMNYLHLYTGLKSSWFFLLVLAVMAFFVLRANWRKPDASSVLRGMGAMCLALFAFAPIAFANYYQFALGLILIGYAATRDPSVTSLATRNASSATAAARDVNHTTAVTPSKSWEPSTNGWVIAYIAVRSFILFNFVSLIVETRLFGEVAEKVLSGRAPYVDFSFGSSPFALLPTLFAGGLSRVGDLHEFLAFHTLFQLAMLICDVVIAWIVFGRASTGRVSKLALAFFVFGPLFVGPLWFTSPVLVTVLFAWIVLAWIERRMRRKMNVSSNHSHSSVNDARAVSVSRAASSRRFVADRFDSRTEALIVLLVGAGVAAFGLVADLAGFDVGFQPLSSPTHVLIWLLALLPLCPPLKPQALRRVTLPAFGLALVAALALSAFLLASFETVYLNPEKFSIELWVRNGLIALSLALLALSLRKGRSA